MQASPDQPDPARRPPAWLRALGRDDLPTEIILDGRTYLHRRTFKHDFFAATGLYELPAPDEPGLQGMDRGAGKVVLKIGRRAPFFGLPLRWIGRYLSSREARLYQRVQSVPGIPRYLGRVGPTGFAHAYVEGRPLAKGDRPGDDFFPRLAEMLDRIHALDVAYVDLEKRENILLGEDGRPYLIDFQISWHWPAGRGGRRWPLGAILRKLQHSDRYHLLKHWRRIRPDQLSDDQLAASYKAPFWIGIHRFLFRPFTQLRRRILVRLGARSSAAGRSPG